AHAIAGQAVTARYHTSNNQFDDVAPWPTTDPVRPFAVDLRDRAGRYRCIALDFDTSKGAAAAEHAQRAQALLDQFGMRSVLVKSGPTDGRHVFFTLQTPLVYEEIHAFMTTMKQRFPTLDTRPM